MAIRRRCATSARRSAWPPRPLCTRTCPTWRRWGCCGAIPRSRAREGVRDIVGPGRLPLVGHVAAGQPVLAEENIEDYVEVPAAAGGDTGEYLLRVRGESMKDAGILEGDFVVVRPQETAEDGEIVVALVGEEATVKRFFREADHVRLQPENATMKPIRSKEVRVLGRVVGLLRSLS